MSKEPVFKCRMLIEVVSESPELCRSKALRMIGTSDTRKELLKEYKKMMKDS